MGSVTSHAGCFLRGLKRSKGGNGHKDMPKDPQETGDSRCHCGREQGTEGQGKKEGLLFVEFPLHRVTMCMGEYHASMHVCVYHAFM